MGEGLDPRGDVRVASLPSRLLRPPPPYFSPPLLYNSPFFPSSTLPSPSHFSYLLPSSPQVSGRFPAEPSTHPASEAVYPAFASFCGAGRRPAAACAAPWCTSARLAAPRTASARARMILPRAASAPLLFGPLTRPLAARSPGHLCSFSPEVSPARPAASRHRSRRLATAPRAPGRGCACGGPGEA